jgi:hypothetical protein
MKKFILSTAFSVFALFFCIPVLAGPSRVYLFDGFVVYLPVPSFVTATEQIKAYLTEHHPDVEFTRINNTHWRSVCNDLKELTPEQKPDRLIFIGHSYGVGAAMSISRCLEGHPVDLIISIDSVQKVSGTSQQLVGENVGVNNNYFETQSILAGLQDNHRADMSYRNITNNHVHIDQVGSAHYLLVNKLVDDNIIQSQLDQYLR